MSASSSLRDIPRRSFGRYGDQISIIGLGDSLKVLRQNLKIARDFAPMSAREKSVYERRLREKANDGRYELYKTSAEHEGEEGRRQHGFPSQEEVAL